MIRFNRENRNRASQDNSKSTGLKRRLPKIDYRPCEYDIPERFLNLKTEIDEYLKKLFSGEIDAGNSNVLDALISDVANEAREELYRQHIVHQDVANGLKAYHDGNRKQFDRELEAMKTDRVSLERKMRLFEEREDNDLFELIMEGGAE